MIKLLILTSLVWQVARAATENNIPKFNSTKVYDLTTDSNLTTIKFVVLPFTSMTYYHVEYERKLVGCRARFDKEGELGLFKRDRPNENCKNPDTFQKSTTHNIITVDGEFRPLITINGQMPGPTIIAGLHQTISVTVCNELPDVEGISIHWHGMHQVETTSMDGVAFISQNPILTHQCYKYEFKAFPAGTHWYHAHSGAHRTDGLYGALIVKDNLTVYGDMVKDCPEQHTLLLMDWQKEPSIDLFYQIRSSLGFFQIKSSLDDTSDPYEEYKDARAADNTPVGPIPFWSGIINDKGRHYDKNGAHNNAKLNVFYVTRNEQYRFRLIGAQALYAYKFSIQNHSLTVVATDGTQIESITDVHYVIVNTGERYDIIVNANQSIGSYWILAETLEVADGSNRGAFYNPVSTHKAEAILRYDGANDTHFNISNSSSWNCLQMNCHFVNCPYKQPTNSPTTCTNVEDFRSIDQNNISQVINDTNIDSLFHNFGFDGEQSTQGSSVDGINFRFPSVLPSGSSEFTQQVCKGRGCDHKATKHCACTHIIDITNVDDGRAVELVLTNYPKISNEMNNNQMSNIMCSPNTTNETDSSHPIHLHGHSFYVVKIGYPEYDANGCYSSANPDITCTVDATNELCERFITVTGENAQTVKWTNGKQPDFNLRDLVAKDTVIVPFGGYTVIRFIADNPGWWLLHCHIEIHQLEGMATVVREGQSKQYL